MSKLIETRRAFALVEELLNQEIRKGGNQAKELARFRETLQAAFYLLGFAQFEFLVKSKSKEVVSEHAALRTADGHAWRHLKQNINGVSLRAQLDIIFHSDPKLRSKLDENYTVRNDVAHNYKRLPPEAQDIVTWLQSLEDVVEKF
ncbi:hypothetical protein AB7645_38160 [Bradyrhizobium sp. 956_D2_N1_5]|uniref:hypothetical protein n=1 Tax=unclassified Bradyrhizobium TaxID=2631580 RepID=UPI003F21C9B7